MTTDTRAQKPDATTVATDDEVTDVSDDDPRSAILKPIGMILSGDLVGLYQQIPRQERVRLEADAYFRLKGGPENDIQYKQFLTMATSPQSERILGDYLAGQAAGLHPQEIATQIEAYAVELARPGSPMRTQVLAALAPSDPTRNTLAPEQTVDVLAAGMRGLAIWVRSAPLNDQEKARQVAACLVRAARVWGYSSLENIRTTPMPDLIASAGKSLRILLDIPEIYGAHLRDYAMPRSVVVREHVGDTAILDVRWNIGGSEIAQSLHVWRVDGQWRVDRRPQSPK